jgi:UDP-GlcNAc:undecaprenyl-phosphate/decaprenyl-phosphate GlcNAc-1-phosphate transferase
MIYVILCFITAAVICAGSVPSIIKLANRISIFDEPGERKLHSGKVPLLGGVAVFAATIFTLTIFAAPYFEKQHVFIITALLILFFFGFRDDILPLEPFRKIAGQALAAVIIIFYSDIRLAGLHGLFGIYTLPYGVSFIVTFLFILFIVNSYNLIDGIDGLAAGLGIISSFFFGCIYLYYDQPVMSITAFALCGSLCGFIPYNFYKAKIFIGDTGTMTIGFLLAIFSLKFLELMRTENGEEPFSYYYAPVILLSILIVPVIDTLRVFAIRLLQKKSPFRPDLNHIHHKLLQLGLSVPQAAIILMIVNLLFISAAWIFRNADPSLVFYYMTASAFLVSQIPVLLLMS